MDFVVTRRSGTVSAKAVRYVDDAAELEPVLKTIAATVGDTFADEYCLLTEVDLDRVTIANARDIVGCALDFDFEAQQAVRDYLSHAPSEVRLRDCNAALNDGDRGLRAAKALIPSGILVNRRRTRLGPEAVLSNCFTN